MQRIVLLLLPLVLSIQVFAQAEWNAKLDSEIQFYQQTDFGVILTGTKKSLYALDAETGEIVWRRKDSGLDETSVSMVPNSDLVLFSEDKGKKARFEALDLFSGKTIWQTDKITGDIMQLAVEPENNLLAVVLVKKAQGNAGETFKRKPKIYVFSLEDGKELWSREIKSEIQMMPIRFAEDKKVSFTLDNFRQPLFLDGKLYVFYEGITAFNSGNGKEVHREKFDVNEKNLALTEADPAIDARNLYVTGRGKIHAIDRTTSKIVWKSEDLGVTPEMFLVDDAIYARIGGQFTDIVTGEVRERGPYGFAAIDTKTGKKLWRYKGADKGLTNFVLFDSTAFVTADKDDIYALDALDGKRLGKAKHKLDTPAFVVRNEVGEFIVGGKDRLAAFRYQNGKFDKAWEARHQPPARGAFKVIGAITLRAAALYFRYGGLANSLYGIGQTGLTLRSALTTRGDFLRARFSSIDLTSLATNYARNRVSAEISLYGIAARARYVNGLSIERPRMKISSSESTEQVSERLVDRLDPTKQIERLSNHLLRRKQMAEFRGNYMYFYTDLPKQYGNNGLIGVNIHTGKDVRFIPMREPDVRFIADEVTGLLFSANDKMLSAIRINR
ncbi:MAG: PQQ-binding-like beta-propeller repeat protein [Pyrinomonadaceae bacterium]